MLLCKEGVGPRLRYTMQKWSSGAEVDKTAWRLISAGGTVYNCTAYEPIFVQIIRNRGLVHKRRLRDELSAIIGLVEQVRHGQMLSELSTNWSRAQEGFGIITNTGYELQACCLSRVMLLRLLYNASARLQSMESLWTDGCDCLLP